MMENRKKLVKSIAAKRIDRALKTKSTDLQEIEWLQDLPENMPAFKTNFAQNMIKSTSKSAQGSILKYMKKRKISPDYLKQNKLIKQDIVGNLNRKLEFTPNNNESSEEDNMNSSMEIETSDNEIKKVAEEIFPSISKPTSFPAPNIRADHSPSTTDTRNTPKEANLTTEEKANNDSEDNNETKDNIDSKPEKTNPEEKRVDDDGVKNSNTEDVTETESNTLSQADPPEAELNPNLCADPPPTNVAEDNGNNDDLLSADASEGPGPKETAIVIEDNNDKKKKDKADPENKTVEPEETPELIVSGTVDTVNLQ